MSEAFVSRNQFAKLEGCDEKQVRRGIESGRLVLSADGKLAVSQVGNGWRKTRRDSKAAAPTAKSSDKRSDKKTVRSEAPDLQDGESAEEAAARIAAAADVVPAIGDSLARKEYFLSLLRELEFREKDGALVDLTTAEQVLFEATRAARDAWLNFPAKVGPQLAAQLGLEADKVTEALSAYVHKQIAELGEPEADFAQR